MTTAVLESYSSPPTNSSLASTPSPLTIRTSPQTTGSDEEALYSSRIAHLLPSPGSTRSRRLDGTDYQNFPWKFNSEALAAMHSLSINHKEVINFVKIDPRLSRMQHCVMCGRQDVHIPSQNKNVCKSCDSCFWLHHVWNVVIKFCKGCKNFFVLDEFQDKPEGTKCKKCRQRGRENYLQKKGQIVTPTIDTAALMHSGHHHHEFFPCGESPVSVTSESDALSTGHKRGNDQIAALIHASNQSFFSTQAFTSIANQVTPGSLLKKPPKMPKKTPTSTTSAAGGNKNSQEGGYFFGSHNSENCINNSTPSLMMNHNTESNVTSDVSSYGTPRVAKKAKFAVDHGDNHFPTAANNVIKSASTPKTLTSNLPSAQLASTPRVTNNALLNTPNALALQVPQSIYKETPELTPSYAHPVTPIVKADNNSSNAAAPMKFIKLNISSNTSSSTSNKYEYSKLYVDMAGIGSTRDDYQEDKPSLGRLDKLKKYSVLADVAQAASPDIREPSLSPTSSSIGGNSSRSHNHTIEAEVQLGTFQRSASTTSNLSCATTSGHCSSDDEAAAEPNQEKWQWDPTVNPLMQLALLTSHEQM